MEKSSIISKNIKENYLKGMKAHSVSYPVIRYEDGKLYLAVYAFYYDKQDITVDKKIVRPKNYALLNIDTGIIEETYDCRRHDFTTGDFNKKYDISDTISKPSEKELEEAFAHLDKARELIKDSNPVFQKEYDEYMKVVMAQTPKEYQRFYRDLSVTENRKKSNKPVISMSMPEAVNGRGRRMQRDAIGNVDVDAKGKEAFVSVFGIENKRTQKTESNENSNSKEQNPVMEMNQSKMQEMLKGDEDKNTSRKEPDEFEKSEYTFRDIAWTPKQDLTQLPERYYQIAKRIAEHINFLPCDKPQIRFEFPIFCFRHDSNPGVDSWMMMQGMVLHRDLPKGHFRPKSNSNLYNIACRDKERCLFYTCPYVIAAYHDLGLEGPRAVHHVTSGKILLADKRLAKWFSPAQVNVMKEAVEDHRASASHAPRSLYGKIVAEADRDLDPEMVIRRTIEFGLGHYPEKTKEEHWQRFMEHMHNKYSSHGYIKLWLPGSDNENKLKQLRELINAPQRMRLVCDRIFDKEKN